ncbi:hypothetical protein NliqN6_5792 [Naganishia liquefaciens]|uniref:Uncharacterized protein n=1 Tax=Naganishia liquefaciens TaxID=104408 RepID=A0A8H3TY70_9TREE|nr:hypothetical protein NliqN6_5792 [Naganishia liquefaciens]
MRFSPSTATFGVAFALINLGLLAYMGAPLPPEPWLSILIIVVVNLLLMAYTPIIISLLSGSHTWRTAGYRSPIEHQQTEAEERMIRRTRVLIFLETYITVFLRGSFKDGQYTDKYHNIPFIILMCFFGLWGGMGAIIMWVADPSTPRPPSDMQTAPDIADIEGREQGIDISLNKV